MCGYVRESEQLDFAVALAEADSARLLPTERRETNHDRAIRRARHTRILRTEV
jgi:hypothetical protein